MPYRKTFLATDQIYHVFNRSVAGQTIFLHQNDYKRALAAIKFYVFKNTPISFSHYIRLKDEELSKIVQKLTDKQITILAYCIMPNHFHFLIKQNSEGGIKSFTANFQNSYAKYFNTKTKRHGALFQSMFKAVRVESDEQLIHVARYIHLNPLTTYIVKDPTELEFYPWSSLIQYLDSNESGIAETDMILNYFKSKNEYKKFIFDQTDYQRKLDRIKHLTFE